jgi:hypothetical protein
MNFLNETIEDLTRNGKSIDDIKFVTLGKNDDNDGIEIEVNNFLEIADFIYDDGYGGNVIPIRLKIVGDTWWLERHEYDGSEWWEFKTLPVKPSIIKICTKLSDGWENETLWEEQDER